MSFDKNFEPQKTDSSLYIMNGLESGGKVKFRVLSDYIDGLCVWGDNEDGTRKITRVKRGESIPAVNIGINRFTGEAEAIKQFIAAIVFNYETERLEIFETSKATIIGQMWDYDQNEEYGDARKYDLTIGRRGEKTETKYTVMPSPPKEPSKAILEAYEASEINLDALYEGKDPFKSNSDQLDQLAKEPSEDVVEGLK